MICLSKTDVLNFDQIIVLDCGLCTLISIRYILCWRGLKELDKINFS